MKEKNEESERKALQTAGNVWLTCLHHKQTNDFYVNWRTARSMIVAGASLPGTSVVLLSIVLHG